MRGFEDWRLVIVVPSTMALVAAVAFAFQANANSAAAFFGSFLAAMATVIALLTGHVSRENERAREGRIRAEELRAAVLELLSICELIVYASASTSARIKNEADLCRKAISKNEPCDPMTTDQLFLLVTQVLYEMPNRVMNQLGRMPNDLAKAALRLGHQTSEVRRTLRVGAAGLGGISPNGMESLSTLLIGWYCGQICSESCGQYFASLPSPD